MTRRLLVSCFPGHGHLNPLLPAAGAFRRAGWQVLVNTGPDLVDVAERHGLPAAASGLGHGETEAALRARRPDIVGLPQRERLTAVLPAMFVDVAARSRIGETIELVDRWRPDLVLHDVTEFAAPLAAMRAGVPHVAHGVGLVGPTPSLLAALRPAVDRLAVEHGIDDGLDRWLATTYVDLCPPSLHGPGGPSFERVLPVRPQAAAAAPGDRLPAVVDALPFARTVHLTLGTVVNNVPGLLETLLAGVTAQPANVVVTVGPDRDPAGLGPLPPSVLAERYLPHSLLLDRCSAVVCHAGAGTLLATLAHGLPVVLVPVAAEQALNAQLAAAAGVAVVVPPETATPETVGAALGRVLDDPEFTARAVAIAAEISTMPGAETVVAGLIAGLPRPAAPVRA